MSLLRSAKTQPQDRVKLKIAVGKRAVSKPKYLAAKLLAIRQQFGVSQYRLARLLRIEPARMSEFERGRRMPNLRVLVYFARVAGVPLEFIVDDDVDLDYFKHYLTVVEQRRGEPTEHHVTLFWRQ